jgi:hypothetical protein
MKELVQTGILLDKHKSELLLSSEKKGKRRKA